MNRDVDRWIGTLVRMPLIALGFVVVTIQRVLFGWLDRPLAVRDEKKLRQDVERELPFLFVEHDGRIVPNEGIPFPPGFDYAFATVAVDNLLIRFCRGRDELDVHIAFRDAPNEWHELCLLLNLIENKDELQRGDILDLRHASRLLEPQMNRLKRVFAGVSGEDLRRKFTDVYARDRIAMREAEWEINKRLRK